MSLPASEPLLGEPLGSTAPMSAFIYCYARLDLKEGKGCMHTAWCYYTRPEEFVGFNNNSVGARVATQRGEVQIKTSWGEASKRGQ